MSHWHRNDRAMPRAWDLARLAGPRLARAVQVASRDRRGLQIDARRKSKRRPRSAMTFAPTDDFAPPWRTQPQSWTLPPA